MGNSASSEDSTSVSFNSIPSSTHRSSSSSNDDESVKNVGNVGYVNHAASREVTVALEKLVKESTRPLQQALRGLHMRVTFTEKRLRMLHKQKPKDDGSEVEHVSDLEGEVHTCNNCPSWRATDALMRRVANLENTVIELNKAVRHTHTLQWATSQAVSNIQRTMAREVTPTTTSQDRAPPADSDPTSHSDPSWHTGNNITSLPSDPPSHPDSSTPSFHSGEACPHSDPKPPSSKSDPSSRPDRKVPPSSSEPVLHPDTKPPSLPSEPSPRQDTNDPSLPYEPSPRLDTNDPSLPYESSPHQDTNVHTLPSKPPSHQDTNAPSLPSEPPSHQDTNAPSFTYEPFSRQDTSLPSEPPSREDTNAPSLPYEQFFRHDTNVPSHPEQSLCPDPKVPYLPTDPSSHSNPEISPLHSDITAPAKHSIPGSHPVPAILTAPESPSFPAGTSFAAAQVPQAFTISSVVPPAGTSPIAYTVAETFPAITSTIYRDPSPSVPFYLASGYPSSLTSVLDSTVSWPFPLSSSQLPPSSSNIYSPETHPQATTRGEISDPTRTFDSSSLLSKEITSVNVSETYPSIFRYASAYAMGKVPVVGTHRPTFFSFTNSRLGSRATATPSGPSTYTSIPSMQDETQNHPTTTSGPPIVANRSVVPPLPSTTSYVRTSTSITTTQDLTPASSNNFCDTSMGNLPITIPSAVTSSSTLSSDIRSVSFVPSSSQSVPSTSAERCVTEPSIVYNASTELPAILTYRNPSDFYEPASISTSSVVTVYNEQPAKQKWLRSWIVRPNPSLPHSPRPGASSTASTPATRTAPLSALDQALLAAATMGDARAICRHLDAGANIMASVNNGHTALHLAAFSGNAYCVYVLLNRGARVNAASCGGWTPLHCAAGGARKPGSAALCLQLLLSAGASPLRQDRAGATPLHVAAGYADASAVRVLLRAGADVHKHDSGRRTAAHLACNEEIYALIRRWATWRAW